MRPIHAQKARWNGSVSIVLNRVSSHIVVCSPPATMAIPRVTHWSTMATALSPGRSTVSSQCLCKYDTALAFRAFKHSLKTRKGQKNRDRVERRTRRKREREWKGGMREGWKLLRLVFNLHFVRQCFPRSRGGITRIKIIFYSRIAGCILRCVGKTTLSTQRLPKGKFAKNLYTFILSRRIVTSSTNAINRNRQQIPIIHPYFSILNELDIDICHVWNRFFTLHRLKHVDGQVFVRNWLDSEGFGRAWTTSRMNISLPRSSI